MRALVTGAGGFLGSYLCPKLFAAGYDVDLMDPRLNSRSFSGLCDLGRFDVVFHLAANIIDIDARSKGGVWAMKDIELDLAMCSWLERHPPTKCAVLMSSCATDAADTDPYAFCKVALERMAEILHKKGVPVVVLKPFSGYGEDQASSYPFPALIDRALRREDPLTVWGSLETVRDWIHVDDLTDAMIHAIDHFPRSPEPVEIGTGIPTKFGDLARMMADAVGYSPKISAVTDKPTSSMYRVANTQMAQSCGFTAERKLEDAIRQAVINASVTA